MTPRWRSLIVNGALNERVLADAEGASGAYAVRSKKTHEVVYVGESHTGNLRKTMLRHFHAAESFTKDRRPAHGAATFGTNVPEHYEVALWVTSKGKRKRRDGDQRAMRAQATWIKRLRPSKNIEDGMADEPYETAEESDDPWGGLLNPGKPPKGRFQVRTLDGLGVSQEFKSLHLAEQWAVERVRLHRAGSGLGSLAIYRTHVEPEGMRRVALVFESLRKHTIGEGGKLVRLERPELFVVIERAPEAMQFASSRAKSTERRKVENPARPVKVPEGAIAYEARAVLAARYDFRRMRDDRSMLMHAVYVDANGREIGEKTACGRIEVDNLADTYAHDREEAIVTCTACAAKVEKTGLPKAYRGKVENPAMTSLGKLTALSFKGRGKTKLLYWPLRAAPVLAYDARKRLHVLYTDRVARPSTTKESAEYKRSHWGLSGEGKVRDARAATGPFRKLGDGVSIVYTTRKGDDATIVDYEHPWGEGRRGAFVPPKVVVHRCGDKRCPLEGAIALEGGSYTVTSHGIVG